MNSPRTYGLGSARERILGVIYGYCLTQSIGVVGWWLAMVSQPEWRPLFWPTSWPLESFWMFAWSDLLLIVPASLLVARLARLRSPRLRVWMFFLLAALLYPTVLSVAASVFTGQGALGATVMTMASLGFLHICGAEYYSDSPVLVTLFRFARSTNRWRHVAVTLLQMIVSWPIILYLIPVALVRLQQHIGVPQFESPGLFWIGILVFLLASLANVWTAWTMTTRGDGTPFPYDATKILVDSGPYSWVRNPMAVSGLSQGLGVAICFGSVFVLVYVICGAVIWQYLVRPIEEQVLVEEFGPPYVDYCERVDCWLPRLNYKR